ncbi:hypothetical protein OS493_007403 [Desmophyllum pertusum]|uniref:Uncharacterized protein n=1 Tax=Desmophyllum pertusum TaxID=174260 RepID=A0A9W9Z3G4_9CNID|nr:hypothetical protein OS493_007403 [Desmophyllum pertusum]
MTNIPSQSRTPSNETTKIIPREPKTEGQEAYSDANTLFAFPLDDSIPVIAKVKIDTETNTLNVILENWNLVSVGQSNTLQQQHNCDCHLDEVLLGSSPNAADCNLEQQQTTTKEVVNQLKPFNKEQDLDWKQAADSGEMIMVCVEPSVPLIKKQGYLNGSQCERILEQLELLQDNGQFEKHEHFVTSYLQRCANGTNTDMELALKMERGVAFSYHKEFKTSKRMFTSVIKSDKGQHCELRNPNILIARAYFLLVEDYRSRRFVKLSPLFEFLRRSEFFLQNHESPEDWDELYFNYGSVWLAYMSMIPDDERNAQARSTARGKARYYYEQAIYFCKKDPRLRVQIKQQTYIYLSLAEMLLDCSSTATRSRQKSIPPADIEEAKEYLDFVRDKLGVRVPTGTRVQLLKIRSDQFYRQGIYELAKETAEDALQIASSNGFNTELDTLQERIDFLDKLCEQKRSLIVIKDISNSSSETCCSESE